MWFPFPPNVTPFPWGGIQSLLTLQVAPFFHVIWGFCPVPAAGTLSSSLASLGHEIPGRHSHSTLICPFLPSTLLLTFVLSQHKPFAFLCKSLCWMKSMSIHKIKFQRAERHKCLELPLFGTTGRKPPPVPSKSKSATAVCSPLDPLHLWSAEQVMSWSQCKGESEAPLLLSRKLSQFYTASFQTSAWTSACIHVKRMSINFAVTHGQCIGLLRCGLLHSGHV